MSFLGESDGTGAASSQQAVIRLHMHCFKASPCPWKKRKERMKSAMKMRTKLMTTALVVDSPTPLAPPVVVNPQLQLTCRDCQQVRQ